tara:strand:+ start:360 stop:485 length:126 start_codon:yes stop_codon:yes gene_type:complete
MLENGLLLLQMGVLAWVFLRVIQREAGELAARKANKSDRFN